MFSFSTFETGDARHDLTVSVYFPLTRSCCPLRRCSTELATRACALHTCTCTLSPSCWHAAMHLNLHLHFTCCSCTDDTQDTANRLNKPQGAPPEQGRAPFGGRACPPLHPAQHKCLDLSACLQPTPCTGHNTSSPTSAALLTADIHARGARPPQRARQVRARRICSRAHALLPIPFYACSRSGLSERCQCFAACVLFLCLPLCARSSACISRTP